MRLDVAVGALTTVLWWCSATAWAWNMTTLYGVALSRARLTDVAVWRNRAYACWPRLDAMQPVTLLELPWPEPDERPQQSAAAAAPWRPRRPFYADQQKLNDCRWIQSAVALDLDKIRGHLYVLDSGYDNDKCQPKIVVFDLKTCRCILSTELDGLDGSTLTSLLVDARPFKGETRVYVGDLCGGHLVVFDPDRSLWYGIALDGPEKADSRVPAEFMAVSKVHSSVFLTSSSSHLLYSASFKDLRNLTCYVTPSVKNGDLLPIGLRVRHEGVKLGGSRGLYADIQGGLNYVYTRDFVAVRLCPTVGGVVPAAEDLDVLLQSSDLLPAVTKIFADNVNYRQVWALNSVPNSQNRHTVKINTLTF